MKGVCRRFLDLPERQLHYRETAGGRSPLVALHPLPGSARQLEALMLALGDRAVLAPDLAGTGDSDPHPAACPQIADYAADVITLIERNNLSQVDLYGSHTGACVAVEIARTIPERIGRIVLDGIPLYLPQEAAEFMAHYAPFVEPDINGTHLLWVHNFCRDQILFWPWYNRTAAGSRGTGLPPARELHDWVVEVIKGLAGVPLGYRAVFTYAMAKRLAEVRQPTLCISAADDILAQASRHAAGLLDNGSVALLERAGGAMAPPASIAALIDAFLE